VPALLPSEEPVIARAKRHWIVMLRRPHRVLAIALLVLLVAAVLWPNPMAFLLVLVLGGFAFGRWQTWRAEEILLTRRRILRVRGVLETTSTESSLRLDRISGVVVEQTVLGKILDYGSIEIEAPGQHPDVRKLRKIARPIPFYLELRLAVFGKASDRDPNSPGPGGGDPDERDPDERGRDPDGRGSDERGPDDRPRDAITAPLPALPDIPRRAES
jgi:hypothetical protein